MTATYTFDVFSTLDGYGSYGPHGDWGFCLVRGRRNVELNAPVGDIIGS